MNAASCRFVIYETVSERRVPASLLRRLAARLALGMVVSLVYAGAAPAVHAHGTTGRPPIVALERTGLRDALRRPLSPMARSADVTDSSLANAIDGREETAWTGRPGESPWRPMWLFAQRAHVGLIRAHWGWSSTHGVPTDFHWEALRPIADSAKCDPSTADDENSWFSLESTEQSRPLWEDALAQPTRRSWFVDANACALRLVVHRTNAGPPVVREVEAIETADDVLADGHATDDGAYPGFDADAAIDRDDSTRWVGAPGKSSWTLRIDLPEPQALDRVRLVLGFDSTRVRRPAGGLTYAIAWAPIHYAVEVSEDGEHFAAVSREPMRANGTILPLRRRLVVLPEPRRVRALRLMMTGASGASGLPEPDAVPVVREIAAYRADDPRPILSAPWLLSVNANPSAQTRTTPGGEAANDELHARFLQTRLRAVLPSADALESIEGDDPELDAPLLARSSPPPIVVLSGSNDWEYAADTGPDATYPRRWHWDPLRDARSGGMGQLARAIQYRVAPFVGFCGGAQILALLEAYSASSEDHMRLVDRVLERTSGQPIRGFAPAVDVDRAWPTDLYARRAEVRFATDSPLFFDLAGQSRRSITRALPEWHADAIRPDAFEPGGPLERFELVAKSAFCSPHVALAGSRDGAFWDSHSEKWCSTIPEAFRSRDRTWPINGAQFHAEQRDFSSAAPGDPPESVADPRLFMAAVYEEMVDAYEKFAP
jgi:hypothetical protein